MRRMLVLSFVAIVAIAAAAHTAPSSQRVSEATPYVDPVADLKPGAPNSIRMTCENKECGGFDWCNLGVPGKICDFSGGLGHCKTRNC